ncbi:MAG: transcription factor [Alphaproteobacteria bacterium]|nr:transcription factor [Alphaproteobacteria bacterium]
MGVSIKDPEAERLLRALADKLDVGLTEAVRVAVQEALDRRQRETQDADVDRLLAWFRSLEVVDDRPIDDLMADLMDENDAGNGRT